mmetsp:Transcript_15220/g.25903  ORF Transcript_15220/g.25903 Transcript_15220/m.25903 type:complete len:225 (-) Transcript_15220:29-703(-)
MLAQLVAVAASIVRIATSDDPGARRPQYQADAEAKQGDGLAFDMLALVDDRRRHVRVDPGLQSRRHPRSSVVLVAVDHVDEHARLRDGPDAPRETVRRLHEALGDGGEGPLEGGSRRWCRGRGRTRSRRRHRKERRRRRRRRRRLRRGRRRRRRDLPPRRPPRRWRHRKGRRRRSRSGRSQGRPQPWMLVRARMRELLHARPGRILWRRTISRGGVLRTERAAW